LEEIGLSELTVEQLEELCEIGEKAARDYVLSKIPSRRISNFDVTVTTEGTKPVNVNIDIELELSPLMKDFNVEKLTDEAVQRGFAAIEEYLRGISCKFKK
jgi:hypothetical protein